MACLDFEKLIPHVTSPTSFLVLLLELATPSSLSADTADRHILLVSSVGSLTVGPLLKDVRKSNLEFLIWKKEKSPLVDLSPRISPSRP